MTEFDVPLDGFRFVELHHGESLQQLAARELGDAARWVDIVNLNGLVPPYIAETRSDPRVAKYGAMLLVPSATALASAVADPDLVFERDVRLRDGVIGVENGDISLVSGRENFKQAIEHRIRVDNGDLIFHQEYGCSVRSVIGLANGPTAGTLAASYVRAAIERDTRVSSIVSMSAEVSGDSITVTGEVLPVTGRAVQVDTGV